jgi:hypothetical protein
MVSLLSNVIFMFSHSIHILTPPLLVHAVLVLSHGRVHQIATRKKHEIGIIVERAVD